MGYARLNRKHGAGVSETEPRSVTLKKENTEYKIWKTRSLTLNMENTECEVKNMENTECDVLSA